MGYVSDPWRVLPTVLLKYQLQIPLHPTWEHLSPKRDHCSPVTVISKGGLEPQTPKRPRLETDPKTTSVSPKMDGWKLKKSPIWKGKSPEPNFSRPWVDPAISVSGEKNPEKLTWNLEKGGFGSDEFQFKNRWFSSSNPLFSLLWFPCFHVFFCCCAFRTCRFLGLATTGWRATGHPAKKLCQTKGLKNWRTSPHSLVQMFGSKIWEPTYKLSWSKFVDVVLFPWFG